MEQNIRINNKKLNGKVISISEDNNKSYLKILLENIDFELPIEKNKFTLGNNIVLTADIEFKHIKIKS